MKLGRDGAGGLDDDGAMRRLSVIGVPSSAGSYAAGQDQAPAALRDAGLVEALDGAGLVVRDEGDLAQQIWRPDRERPFAQNADQVAACLQDLADRLTPLLAEGDTVLVIGGNCTIALSVMAALERLNAGTPGLLYLDRHLDLNTPDSTTDGALDWMGLAHAFALPGSVDSIADAFGRRPLLQPRQVAWLGVDANPATEWEREQAAHLELHVTSSQEFVADPPGTTVRALGVLPSGPLAVHVDVDVLDFIDAPLAENTDCRNTGPTLDQLAKALQPVARDPRLRALSVGELNPTRSAGEPEAIPRFIRVLATALSS
jgi:arginase